MLDKIKYTIENIFKIGSIRKVSGADGELQEVQIKTIRNIEDAIRLGIFGFNSKAPINSRCIIAKIGNENIVIANEHIASIIDVNSGDSIMYNQTGSYIKMVLNIIEIHNKAIFDNDVEVIGKIIGNSISMSGVDGVSGTFISADSKTITVTNGIITNIA